MFMERLISHVSSFNQGQGKLQNHPPLDLWGWDAFLDKLVATGVPSANESTGTWPKNNIEELTDQIGRLRERHSTKQLCKILELTSQID